MAIPDQSDTDSDILITLLCIFNYFLSEPLSLTQHTTAHWYILPLQDVLNLIVINKPINLAACTSNVSSSY